MTLKVVAVLFAMVREEMVTSAAKGGKELLKLRTEIARML